MGSTVCAAVKNTSN